MSAPGYWMDETSGVLKPAVEAYLKGGPIRADQVAALRAYFRQWIMWSGWAPSRGLHDLRARLDELDSREAIERWLDDALDEEIDPL